MTVFALATVPGRAAIAVVRISGDRAGAALKALCGDLPTPRRAVRRKLRQPDGAAGDILDDALVLWFPGPDSFNGEDMVELHLHGGRAVVSAVLECLAALPGLSPAEPGAFTRRAFDNGKLDLTAIEGLADLVAAESEAQRRQALRQLDGALGALYESWRETLVGGLALMEAAFDFADEDLPKDMLRPVNHDIRGVLHGMNLHLDDDRRGERLRDGLFVAIVGAPNVGKSSLLNRLARRDAAIVSHHAGTTRDVVEVHMDIAGLPVILADTAGLRDSVDDGADFVEREGADRALARAAAADLKIAVFDGTSWPKTDSRTRALVDENCLIVVNKADLMGPSATVRREDADFDMPIWALSCLDGRGFDEFLAGLEQALNEQLRLGSSVVITRRRHRSALMDCSEALARFLDADSIELAAEDLRLAVRALGRITGAVDVEDLLDIIFADFCIGK